MVAPSRARDGGGQVGLMKLARQTFGESAEDQFRIIVGEEQTA